MSLQRFMFKGEVYDVGGASDITLRDLMVLEQETRDLGWTIHMGEIVRLGELFESLSMGDAKVHPEAAKMLAITIWLGMVKKLRDSGDFASQVPFATAIDASLADFVPVDIPRARPQDHQSPRKPRTAKKTTAKKSASARSGSGRGAARAVASSTAG